jgi:mannose/cellobiose epimerase-like protein (N-acyl-D-glucosamine 2-epimerase family)
MPPDAAPVLAPPQAPSRSDTVVGYLAGVDGRRLRLDTVGGTPVTVALTDAAYASVVRNLGEGYADATAALPDRLPVGQLVIVRGPVYQEAGVDRYTAGEVILLGDGDRYAFETPHWWIRQLHQLARFYRTAQFGTGDVDVAAYRTMLHRHGDKLPGGLQETDTLSRLVYGMATGYLLTGDEDLLDVAEKGAEYQRRHMRFRDAEQDVTYWYHAVVRDGDRERKLFGSEFGDDYHAVAAYEQIYALVGLVQTYRVTGDPALRADIESTVRLFHRFFADPSRGGYFSHLDPVELRPDAQSLGDNRMRKNWNSIGDHAPAYLFNLYLATGDPRHLAMLEETFDLIVSHFPDPAGVPFVRERFHADWAPDTTWRWQQDRAVVGHNLKIAWNLTRMHAARPKPEYRALAARLAAGLPAVGRDPLRGGWYDVVQRLPQGGRHDFVWHDRKAWWQQEQAILAYLVHAGHYGAVGADGTPYLRHAREAAGFYNAFFLDHDEGGVYFAVQADGTPHLTGNERYKGSHAMSMYHAAELCYLATVYDSLLVRGEPLALWFRPRADADFPDGVLRVAPDVLPRGRVRLAEVSVDGRPYHDFDPQTMAIRVPAGNRRHTVRAVLRRVAG